jgi:SAM-dependent methyltransferase
MSQGSNQRFYEEFAEVYESVYAQVDEDAAVGRWVRLLEDVALLPAYETRLPTPPALIDIGCGPGWYLPAWRKLGFKPTGIDTSPAMLSLAQKSLRLAGIECPLVLGDVLVVNSSSPLAGRFQVAVSHLFFPNLFSPKSLGKLMMAVSSLLTPGGIWISDWRVGLADVASSSETLLIDGTVWTRKNAFDLSSNSFVQCWTSGETHLEERFWNHDPSQIRSAASAAGLNICAQRQFLDTPQSHTLVLQSAPN